MGLYRSLRPIKRRSQWYSIGSILELDDEDGKALSMRGAVVGLGTPGLAINHSDSANDADIRPLPARALLESGEEEEAAVPAKKAGRQPRKKS